MKLEELHIGASPLTDRVYLGSIGKTGDRTWAKKVDFTGKFIGALMSWCRPGSIRTVTDNHGNRYEVEVRAIAEVQAIDAAMKGKP